MSSYFVLQGLSHGSNGTLLNWLRHFDITITILLISVVGTHKLSHNICSGNKKLRKHASMKR